MKITKFLNIDIEPAPPEMELQVEMQCREIMQAKHFADKICEKSIYTHLCEIFLLLLRSKSYSL